jgi:hypothetical protein
MNYTLQLRLLLPIAITAALLGAACSDGDDDAAFVDSASNDESADTTLTTDDEPETTERTTDTTDTGDDSEDTGGGSLGSSTGQQRHDGLDDLSSLVPLRIEVTGLERNGELVELAMTLTNEDEALDFTPNDVFTDLEWLGSQYNLTSIRLIDQGERKAYLPVVDSEDVCLCSDGLNAFVVAAGESAELHASFGGIPETVTTLDLEVPGFSPIAGIEVQD